MSSSRPWVKLWESWWSSRSHGGVKFDHLAIGARIMSLTGAAPEQDGEARFCLQPDGEPFSVADIAAMCRKSPKTVREAIAKLASLGTMVVREDGAVGFPKWDEYQLSPSALRMRRKRHLDRHSDARCDGGSARTLAARGQRSEVRGEQETPRELPLPPREQRAREPVAALRERWSLRLLSIRSELTAPVDPLADPQGFAGAEAALQLHGLETVLGVIEHSVREASAHHESDGARGTDPARVATMFRGQGFGAHHGAWLKAEKRRRGAAMQPPHKLAWRTTERLLSDDDQRWWRVEASGGAHPGALEVELRARWDAEAEKREREAARLREEIGL